MSSATKRHHWHCRLWLHVLAVFVVILVTFSLAAVILHQRTKSVLLSASNDLFRHVGNEIEESIAGIYNSAALTASLLANSSFTASKTLEHRLDLVPLLADVTVGEVPIIAAYVGWSNGEFFLVRSLSEQERVKQILNAPESALFAVQSRSSAPDGSLVGQYFFYDSQFRSVGSRIDPEYTYDPRERPWYVGAGDPGETVITDPYIFYTTLEVGTTVAEKSRPGNAVAAVDIALSGLGNALTHLKPTPSAQLAIYDSESRIVAQSGAPAPLEAPQDGGTLNDFKAEDRKLFFSPAPNGELTWQGQAWYRTNVPLDVPGADGLGIVIAAPQTELLIEAYRLRNWNIVISTAIIIAAAAVSFGLSRLVSRPLNALVREAADIRALRFTETPPIESSVTEVRDLADVIALVKGAIRQLLEMSLTLPSERNFDKLIDHLLEEIMSMTRARVAGIYLVEEGMRLQPLVGRRDTGPLGWLPEPLDIDRDVDHPVVRAAKGEIFHERLEVDDIARFYPRLGNLEPVNILAMPLKSRSGEVLGVMILSHALEEFTDAEADDLLTVIRAISGMAASAIETQRLIAEQKRLLDAFIKLIADAIDRKSPYTGGHCRRVPELTEMLAAAANEAKEGPFHAFSLNEEEWEELRIAAWLHDCGKINTPEHVVDKATKLETVYDRLHEIRTRFEVIKREAEARSWQEIADGANRKKTLAELDQLWRELDDDYAFIAGCNDGSVSMGPDEIERLHAIGRRRWTRTLDDRIGLSTAETARKILTPAPELPASEPLLSDRPDQLIMRTHHNEKDELAATFTLVVPDHLENKGEIHNLSIEQGTLTEEERYRINEHVVESIRMLESLPFPAELANVSDIAGSHHERMDGKGYPRSLRAEHMSVRARVLAIADIFEALTARDRPYRNPVRLSEAIATLAEMRDDGHIDPDLFDLFLTSGIYRAYAEKYLTPEQIDEVDVVRYLRSGVPAERGAPGGDDVSRGSCGSA